MGTTYLTFLRNLEEVSTASSGIKIMKESWIEESQFVEILRFAQNDGVKFMFYMTAKVGNSPIHLDTYGFNWINK